MTSNSIVRAKGLLLGLGVLSALAAGQALIGAADRLLADIHPIPPDQVDWSKVQDPWGVTKYALRAGRPDLATVCGDHAPLHISTGRDAGGSEVIAVRCRPALVGLYMPTKSADATLQARPTLPPLPGDPE